MAVNLSTGLRKAMLNVTGLKGALANGIVYLYSGPQPANADAAVQGTLLAKVTVSAGAFSFGTGTNGLNFATATTATIGKSGSETWQAGDGAGVAGCLAAGTIGWGRFMGNASDALGSSTTLARMDFSVGISGADLNVPVIDVAVLTPLTIDTFNFTLPVS